MRAQPLSIEVLPATDQTLTLTATESHANPTLEKALWGRRDVQAAPPLSKFRSSCQLPQARCDG